MQNPSKTGVVKQVDSIQQQLTSYAGDLSYCGITAEAVHAAKLRTIDTLGALIGAFFGEPCWIARNLAAQMPYPNGATVIGTRMKTAPDLAAFINASTARYPELTDSYHWPGSSYGHPSDVVTPVFAAAEYARSSGRDFLTGIVLAYEVYLRISNVFHNNGFDHTNFCCLGTALAAGKLLGLSTEQLSHCVSMAVVPNVTLRQVRTDPLSMWKAVASGQAGRAGVFAAMLARAGMEGPHLPFEGKAGWCDHVAGGRFQLEKMGGSGTPFKILDTRFKLRPSSGEAQSTILAAEKVSPLRNLKDVKKITVELYKKAKLSKGTGAHQWNPDSREAADHSVPYLVAVTLMDGTVTLRSFNDARLWNPELRALMQKIEVTENEEFTRAYERRPVEHRTRITVLTFSGERLVGETGGDEDDFSMPKSDAQIEEKFRGLTEDMLGAKRANTILEKLWHLEDVKDVSEIPPLLLLH